MLLLKKSIAKAEKVSRRDFFKLMGGVGLALAGTGVATAHENKGLQDSSYISLKRKNLQDQGIQFIKKHSVLDTIVKSYVVMISLFMINCILAKLKVNHGNQAISMEEFMDAINESPFSLLIQGGVLAPLVEEGIFRFIPNCFINKLDKGRHWEIGIPTSSIFALLHNLKRDEVFGNLTFSKSIPISQFLKGLFCWYLMREKGYSHAFLGHAISNLSAITTAIIYSKIKQKENISAGFGGGLD